MSLEFWYLIESIECFECYVHFNNINLKIHKHSILYHLCLQFLSSKSYSFHCIDFSLPWLNTSLSTLLSFMPLWMDCFMSFHVFHCELIEMQFYIIYILYYGMFLLYHICWVLLSRNNFICFCLMLLLPLMRWLYNYIIFIFHFISCITFIHLHMLNHPYFPEINFTWHWCMNRFIVLLNLVC